MVTVGSCQCGDNKAHSGDHCNEYSGVLTLKCVEDNVVGVSPCQCGMNVMLATKGDRCNQNTGELTFKCINQFITNYVNC